jgi:hypothetical protein
MLSRPGSSRARSRLFLFAAVVAGVGWLGCGTNNGDPAEDEELGPTPTATAKEDAGARPDFEAGFPEDDAGNVDPTPDGGDTCVDNGDPGSSENTAKALPNTDDAQNNPITVKGVLNGPVDVDFYKLTMADLNFHLVEADLQTQTPGVEFCAFVRCKGGGPTTVSGCNGGVLKTSDIGTKGCCATGPSKATPKWDCTGFTDDDSADFFIRVRQTQDKCTAYTWSYAF